MILPKTMNSAFPWLAVDSDGEGVLRFPYFSINMVYKKPIIDTTLYKI